MLEYKDEIANTPYQSSSSENVLESVKKQIPHHRTICIPQLTYEPDLTSKARCPMRKYVSEHHLS